MEGKRDWIKKWFVDYPVGFVIVLIIGITSFVLAASVIEIPTYDTVRAMVVEDGQGICLELATEIVLQGNPIYLYQERDAYIEKIDTYDQRSENGRVYVNETKFSVGDTVSVDIEKGKLNLLNYVFD